MKLQIYKVVEQENKVLRVLKDDEGWLYIVKLPPSKDNIFFCIEELEMVVDAKLELLMESEINLDAEVQSNN